MVLSCGPVLKVTLTTVFSLIIVLRLMVVLFSHKVVGTVMLLITVVLLNSTMLSLRIISLVLMVVLLIGLKELTTVFWKTLHLRTTSQTDPVVLYSGSVLMVLYVMLLLLIIGL